MIGFLTTHFKIQQTLEININFSLLIAKYSLKSLHTYSHLCYDYEQ